jgi:hypothetical protein
MSCVGGFRFVKAPLFFADSPFLNSPSRMMLLIMIIVLALLVSSLAERKLQLALQQNAETIRARRRNEVGASAKAIADDAKRAVALACNLVCLRSSHVPSRAEYRSVGFRLL